MEIRRRFPYDPPLRHIGYVAACVLIVAIPTSLGWFSFKFGVTGTIVLSLGVLLLTVRRLAFRRHLELENDALVLPAGFLRAQITRVPYSTIGRVWERSFFWGDVLFLDVGKRTLEIHASCLPDSASFMEIRDFLIEREDWRASRLSSDAGTPFPGNRYSTACTYHGDGDILSFEEGRKEGRVVFRFRNEPQTKTLIYLLPRPLYGLVRIPEFVVYDPDGKEVFRIRRTRRFPCATFEMRDGKELRATIVRRHPLFSSYDIRLAGGPDWRFKLPLFTINFFGESSIGGRLRALLDTHNQWFMIVDTNHDSPYLIHALAFIHRERMRVG